MSNGNIIFLSIVAIILIVYLIDRFTGRKITEKIILWKPTLVALSTFVGALAGAAPTPQLKIISYVLKVASDATQEAEELWKMDKLPKNERNDFAQLMIADALKKGGIEVTDQIQTIIDGCIAVVCMILPHEKSNITPDSISDADIDG